MKESLYRQQIDSWIDAHRDEMIDDLKTMIRIPSIRSEEMPDAPFGTDCADAVKAMQKLMERYGLETKNWEMRLVTGDLSGEREKTLDILTHLDVVPVSDTWKETAPFDPCVKDDRIYGRGAIDDKGPSIAALYALRAIRELGIKPVNGVRLICGSNEESGLEDLKYYYAREQEALYTFTPDGNYPLINIEKGRLVQKFEKSGCRQCEERNADRNGRILSLKAGETVNVVPGDAELVLSGVSADTLKQAIRRIEEGTGAACTVKSCSDDDCITVIVSGTAAHASLPASGVNALTAALALTAELDLEGDGERTLAGLSKRWPHGDYCGKALGVDVEDPASGKTSMALTILNYQTDGDAYSLTGQFDARTSIAATDENTTELIRKSLDEIGCITDGNHLEAGHYVDPDSRLVQKLLESYELYFEEKGTPLAIGGWTYVHHLKGGVAFGCEIEGIDNHMHGDDEFIDIPVLVKSAKAIADAILRLCGTCD